MYYTRIRLSRMATLLGLGDAEAEEALSQLVVSNVVRAKIDRPAAIVYFRYGHIIHFLMFEYRISIYSKLKKAKYVNLFFDPFVVVLKKFHLKIYKSRTNYT